MPSTIPSCETKSAALILAALALPAWTAAYPDDGRLQEAIDRGAPAVDPAEQLMRAACALYETCTDDGRRPLLRRAADAAEAVYLALQPAPDLVAIKESVDAAVS